MNRKLAGWLLGALALLGAGGHFLHGYQVRRHADLWLRQAAAAKEQGNIGQSLEYLSRYLTFEPGNTDALFDYGLMLEQLDPSPRTRWHALSVLEQVLTRRPGNREVRRHLVRLTMSLGRFAEARAHLDALLAASPEDGELEHLVGQCLEGTGDYAEAAAWYEKAIKHAPDRIASYERLAELLQHRLDEGPRAAEVLDRMVAANEESFRAYLIRARFGWEKQPAEQIAADIRRARQLAPAEPEVLLAVAELASRTGKRDEARDYLRKGLDVHPRHVALYLALAELEFRGQRPAEAVACLRRGLTALPDQTDLLQALADLLIQQDQGAQAGELIARLHKAGAPLARAGYWEARLRMHDRQWPEAARLLEDARVALAAAPEWLKQVELALGRCYEQTGDRDRQLAAYRRAVALEPASAPARYGLGVTLLGVGRVSEAVGELWQTVRLPGAPKEAWTALARALVVRNRHLAPDRRDWQEVERVLEQAEHQAGASVQGLLVRAEALLARQQPEQARALLEQAREKQPDQVEIWIALANLAEHQGRPQAAGQILEEARQRVGDRIELRRERLHWLARWGGANARQDLAEIEQDLEKFPAADQDRLLGELAAVYFRRGYLTEAERVGRRLAERQPRDLRCRLLLTDLYLQTGDVASLGRVLADVCRIEGSGGAQWRLGEASRLILRAKQGDRQGLVRARAYLTEAARQRPDWARVPLAEAALDELQGNLERAIQDYRRALELGDCEPGAAYRLAQLLVERRRFGEAERVIRRLEEQVPLAGPLGRLAAEVALANRDHGRAVELARRAVAPSSRDYRDQLWLSHILEAAGQLGEAEERLRAAVQQAGTVPDTWAALVRFLAVTGQPARAEAVLQDARRRLSPEQVPLTLALCYEALAQPQRAAEQYRAALAARPDDPVLLHQAAAFHLRAGTPAEAEPLLRRLVDPAFAAEEHLAWARRQLAFLLAADGTDPGYREAFSLVERNLSEYGGAVEDQRAKARVLATRPERQREALGLLEGSRASRPLTPEDQRLLAQLYDAAGDRANARDQWLTLLGAEARNASYVASYIQALLHWGELGEAQRWLTRLEQLEPQSHRGLTIRQALEQARARTDGQEQPAGESHPGS